MTNPFEEITKKFESRFDSIEELIRNLKGTQEKEEERLLSPAEAAKLFIPQVSKQTLHAWSEQGLLVRHRLGGRIYYKRSEILASVKTLKKFARR